jgi:hypothetical protein
MENASENVLNMPPTEFSQFTNHGFTLSQGCVITEEKWCVDPHVRNNRGNTINTINKLSFVLYMVNVATENSE